MENYEATEEKAIMRHPQEEVIEAFNHMTSLLKTDEDSEKYTVIIEYVEDLVATCEEYKKESEFYSELVVKLLQKASEVSKRNMNNAKKQYIERVRRMNAIKKKIKPATLEDLKKKE